MSRSQYLFGDSDSAAQRLRLLASVYRESTRAFLMRAAGSGHFDLALDLGCGLGFTSHLIGNTLQCKRVICIDASAVFIKLARDIASERVSFIHHDVTSIPFPTGSANHVFSRFLLTHLRDPAYQVAKWPTQLKPEGLLLLEEAESIQTSHPEFSRYLAVDSRKTRVA